MQKVYADVFEQIITEMEQGRTPWVRPWTGGGPYNAATGRRYSGGNVIALLFAGAKYTAQGWLTWNQAIEAGCVVRKGEKSTTVFFMSKAVKKAGETDESGEPDSTGKAYFFARGFRVFNVEQLDELEPGALDRLKARHTPETLQGFEAIEEAEELVERSGAEITHGGGVACYIPSLDVIRMPEAETFTSREGYYATLFHELAHWTGGEKRLKRITPARFGSETYAFEELVAELASAFLSGRFGFAQISQSAAYLKGWAKACRQHPEMLAKAASLAQKAADYLTGEQSAPVAVEAAK
jgi:antirestriction protein ArdC